MLYFQQYIYICICIYIYIYIHIHIYIYIEREIVYYTYRRGEAVGPPRTGGGAGDEGDADEGDAIMIIQENAHYICDPLHNDADIA